MASGDTKTQTYLEVAAKGNKEDIQRSCCDTRTQTLILDVAERIIKLQDEIGDIETNPDSTIARVIKEEKTRAEADEKLQEEIDGIKNNPDVVDVVATKADLDAYDTSTLTNNDIIRVLQDETHDGASTYYRWSTKTSAFTFIGEAGDYYTKTQSDRIMETERVARIKGDEDSQTNLEAEIAARIAGDKTLQTNIDNEAATRKADDETLQANIDAEAATRKANDETLQTNIDNEETARIAGDEANKNDLEAEIAARKAADTTLQTNIDNEAATRKTNDDTLQANIDAEAATRKANDDTLQANIDAEEEARIAGDEAIKTDLTAEKEARIAGDNTLQTNIDNEATTRKNADDDLQAKITAEETARKAADEVLQTNIDNEEAARKAADETLQANIDAEEAARKAADDDLLAKITAEEEARKKADEEMDAAHKKWGKENFVQKVSEIPTSSEVAVGQPFVWIGDTTAYGDTADFFTYGRMYEMTSGDPAIIKVAGVDGLTDVTIDGVSVVEDDTAKIKTDQKTVKNGDNGLTINNAKELWDIIYPIGSVYVSISGDPNSMFTGTTWTQITGCTLWATTDGGGGALAGSLPKIEGYIKTMMTDAESGVSFTGAFYDGGQPRSRSWSGSGGSDVHSVGFQASRSNSIYSAAAGTNVVRPTSIAVKMWKRTA